MFRPVLASSSVPGGPFGSGSLFYFSFEGSGFGLVSVFIYFKYGTWFWFFSIGGAIPILVLSLFSS